MAEKHKDPATNTTSAFSTQTSVPVQSSASSDNAGSTNATAFDYCGSNAEEKTNNVDLAAAPDAPLPRFDINGTETASVNTSTTSCYITPAERCIDSRRSAGPASLADTSPPLTGSAASQQTLPATLSDIVEGSSDGYLIAADAFTELEEHAGHVPDAQYTLTTTSESDLRPPPYTNRADTAVIVGPSDGCLNLKNPEHLLREIRDAKQTLKVLAQQEALDGKKLTALLAKAESFVKLENRKRRLLDACRKTWLKRCREEARARSTFLEAEEALKEAAPHMAPLNETMAEPDKKRELTRIRKEEKAKKAISKFEKALRKASANVGSAKETMDMVETQYHSAGRCKVAAYGRDERFRSHISQRDIEREQRQVEARKRICEAEEALTALGRNKEKCQFC